MAKVTCPKCKSSKIQKRTSSWLSFSIVAFIFGIGFIISKQDPRYFSDYLTAGGSAIAIILFIPMVVLGIRAIPNKNKCKECNNRWHE
jgi:hypothetical protein